MLSFSDIETAELAFAAFLIVAICAFGIILIDAAISAALRSRGKRPAPAPAPQRSVTPAQRPPSASR